MNICITGAAGHIGSYLIRNLQISTLDKVYLVDNFLTQRYASLFDLPRGINYRFYEMDILSDDIESLIRDSDVVVHLAAVTNAETSFQNNELINRINKAGLEHVCRLCAAYNRLLLFFSTTSVYGPQGETVKEDCKKSELQPQSPYAESKLYAETFIHNLAQERKLDFIILRLGTIVGYSVGMRFHTAVNKFIWQASTGQEITVWRTALNQKRPYCVLNDCTNAINYIIQEKIFDRQIYNIVSANLTVDDILKMIKEFIPDIKIRFVDSPIMNQLSYNVSNRKSLKRGFKYNDKLKEIIKEVICKLRNINYKVLKKNLL